MLGKFQIKILKKKVFDFFNTIIPLRLTAFICFIDPIFFSHFTGRSFFNHHTDTLAEKKTCFGHKFIERIPVSL